MNQIEEQAILVYETMNSYRKNPFNVSFDAKPIVEKIRYFIENKKPIKMILPACHGKAASPDCVISNDPDMGEYIGIKNFSALCEDINKHYSHGTNLVLIHEGHFYINTPLVQGEEIIDHYLGRLRAIISKYRNLKSIALNDFFPSLGSNENRRDYFIKNYSPTSCELNQLLDKNSRYKNLYVSYKKIYSKYILPQKFPTVSQKKIDKEAKEHAIMQLKIYCGFSRLEKDFFKEPYIRLSALYKEPSDSNQIAVNYLPNRHTMATPAFYSVVKYKNDTYNFIKKNEAVNKGYKLVCHDTYPYFEEI